MIHELTKNAILSIVLAAPPDGIVTKNSKIKEYEIDLKQQFDAVTIFCEEHKLNKHDASFGPITAIRLNSHLYIYDNVTYRVYIGQCPLCHIIRWHIQDSSAVGLGPAHHLIHLDT